MIKKTLTYIYTKDSKNLTNNVKPKETKVLSHLHSLLYINHDAFYNAKSILSRKTEMTLFN